MHIPLVKVLLLVVDTVCTNYGMRPPRPPPSSQEQQKFFRRDALSGNYQFDIKYSLRDTRLKSFAFPWETASSLRITPAFFIGFVLAITGGVIRVSCHHALGKFFTWQLSVQDDHKLVTTGPSSVVRHPSHVEWGLITIGIRSSRPGPTSSRAASRTRG
ncbi:hypothetical protein ACG7TL_002820 [Trametes sanguinea]